MGAGRLILGFFCAAGGLAPVLAQAAPLLARDESGIFVPAAQTWSGLVVFRSLLLLGLSAWVLRPTRLAAAGLVLLGVSGLFALLALPAPRNELMVRSGIPREAVLLEAPLPLSPLEMPGPRFGRPGIPGHWLGTDAYGRDVLARLLHALAESLFVALCAVALALALAVLAGGIAGLLGGVADGLAQALILGVAALPALVLVLAVQSLFVFDRSLLVLLLGLVLWTTPARLFRAEILRLRHAPFVEALRGLGIRGPRLLFGRLLRHASPPLLVHGAFALGHVVVIEAALSFLGFGVPPPLPSLGELLAQGQENPGAAPHLVLVPGLLLFILLLGTNRLGEGLRIRLLSETRR
jgi:peptide/nickel transport system permease protein